MGITIVAIRRSYDRLIVLVKRYFCAESRLRGYFNIRILSSEYENYHCEKEPVARKSHIDNDNPIHEETVFCGNITLSHSYKIPLLYKIDTQ